MIFTASLPSLNSKTLPISGVTKHLSVFKINVTGTDFITWTSEKKDLQMFWLTLKLAEEESFREFFAEIFPDFLQILSPNVSDRGWSARGVKVTEARLACYLPIMAYQSSGTFGISRKMPKARPKVKPC